MEVVNKHLNEIKPYFNNPRDNKKAVMPVANSIKEFGFQQPIVVDKDNVIIVGHTRYQAAKRLKLATVPVVVANDLSPEKVKAYRLADNKTNELSDWDVELLNSELLDIENINMNAFGFEDEAMEEESSENDVDISDNLNEKFQVIVNCKDEEDLETTYEKLKGDGYDCDISTL